MKLINIVGNVMLHPATSPYLQCQDVLKEQSERLMSVGGLCRSNIGEIQEPLKLYHKINEFQKKKKGREGRKKRREGGKKEKREGRRKKKKMGGNLQCDGSLLYT